MKLSVEVSTKLSTKLKSAFLSQILFLCAAFLINTPSAKAEEKKQVWIYTSIYKEYISKIETEFEKKYPHIDLQVFQAGSEKIQAKVEAEILAQKIQADVLAISGPFWAYGLQKRNLLETMSPSSSKKQSTIDTNYNSLMVLIYNQSTTESTRPKSFMDLTKPEFKKLVQFGSPLESGTAFATVAYLSDKYGWPYFEKLSTNFFASSGGNSTVIQKVESGEKKYGVVLLENALAAIKKGSPIGIIYPDDGSIPIPSVQMVLKDSPHKIEAKILCQFLLSKEGQEILRSGYMYSVRNDVKAPEGAEPLQKITQVSTAWTAERFIKFEESSKAIKKKFSEIVLE